MNNPFYLNSPSSQVKDKEISLDYNTDAVTICLINICENNQVYLLFL